MRDLLKPALTLLAVCFGVALCLAFVNELTKDKIAERTAIDTENQRRQVMTEASSFTKLDPESEGIEVEGDIVKEVYEAFDGEKFIGYVFGAVVTGYGGDINVTVGVTLDGRVTAVRIGENTETPGLGSKVKEDGYTGQYSGKVIDVPLNVVTGGADTEDEIQAISGATISSNAVTLAVNSSCETARMLLEDRGDMQ